jgi:di/tricarboxylate transporter
MSIVIVSAILVVAVVLFVSEKLPVDLTALAVLVALMVLGILTPDEGISNFANPAPITVGILFVVSKGLIRTGALDFITARIIRYSKGNPKRILFLSLFLVGGFSSFLNNTPVVILFISVIMAVCCEYSLSPSKFLMPISFISILAGTSTLIGTSTNIIVSNVAAQNGVAPIGMFELSILGMPMAMIGAVFLYFLAPKILGDHREPLCLTADDKNRYVSELLVPKKSPLVSGDITQTLRERSLDVEIFEVIRDAQVFDPNLEDLQITAGDKLLVRASADQLGKLLSNQCAVLPREENGTTTDPHDRKSLVVELLVQPNSDAVGRRLAHLLDSLDWHVHLIGVKRHWAHYEQKNMDILRLAVGDILLVRAPLDHLDQIRTALDMIVLEDVHQTIINRRKAPLAMGIFGIMVLATAFGVANILLTSIVAMLAMLITGCLSLREAYRAVDARILILIVGTLSLGMAISKTGAADLYADALLTPLAGFSPWVVLSAFILLTSVLSLFLSNNATAVLLIPIALSTAAALQVDPRPFVIGICFGASACYATPIGYQTNMLVFGPGGYSFKDYLKLGIPLNIWVWLMASIFVPIIWPF